MTMLANPERLMHEALAAALQPPPPVDYLQWAVDNIVFTKRETPEPGPYNPSRFSYFNEVLGALSPSDPCRVVTLMKSAQLGGTVLANVFTAGSMDMDPGDFMYAHPTENNAQRWSKMKLKPLLRSTEALKKIFPERPRDGGDSTLYKERADGLGAILISGANSPASLSQVTMPRQVQDDLSKWENNAGGDPESQADSRSRAITFAKIFKISTPLVTPGCRITRAFEAGSQERCYVPCPHCEEMQTLEWENMKAAIEGEEDPEKAYFTCVACGCVIEEHHRKWMLERHEWRPANPRMKRLHRSFYIWSAYSFLQSWRQIRLEWEKGKGDPEAEQTFLNDTVGLAFQAQSEAPPWEGLRDRAAESPYARGTIPPGALLLTMGMDCQIDRVEWQLVGWGRDLKRYVIDRGVVPGHISEPRTQELLSAHIGRTWPNSFGRQVGIDLAAIDGNAFTEDVWGWAKNHPTTKVVMVRGVGSELAPLLARVKRERNRAGVITRYSSRFYNFAASNLKSTLYRQLAKREPDAVGFVAFPRGLEDDYFQQLTSEHRKPVSKGSTVYKWDKIDRNAPNEMLDTMLQAEAAAIKLGLRAMSEAVWDRYQAEREGEVEMRPTAGPEGGRPRSPREQAEARKAAAAEIATDKTGRLVGRSPREQALLDKYGRAALTGVPARPVAPPAPKPAPVAGWAALLKRKQDSK